MKTNQRRLVLFWLGSLPLIAAVWFGCSDEASPTGPGLTTHPPIETIDTIPPATVNALAAKSPGVRSLGLQWVAPGDNGWSGTAASYDIRYSTSPISADNWDEALTVSRTPKPIEGGRIQKCSAIGLEPATKYYFAMKASDESSNVSDISNVANGITAQEGMPPSEITDLAVSELGDGKLLLTWTALGDDGVLGRASEYDVRCYGFGIVSEENWDLCTPIPNTILPSAPGEPESLIVEVEYPERNYSFGIKVGDEVTNWSYVSNPALAPGTESYLWTYPQLVQQGEEMTIVFRAPGNDWVEVELYYLMGTCGLGEVTLFSGSPSAGIYTIVYDFYDPKTDTYQEPNWYQVSICINGERQDLNRVQFLE
ncbi:MAG: hypothetical protein KAJ17_13550 [Candidatus Krumholzibacteria bacterium]|nr:hypothetical protein [Candidatus Krumholzibacteria bacterium]